MSLETRVDVVFDVVAKHTDFSKQELLNARQGCLGCIDARFLAITLVKRGLGLSVRKTAAIFNVDAKTVRYAMDKVLGDQERLVKAILMQAEINEVTQ